MRGIERLIRPECVCGNGLTGRPKRLSAGHTGLNVTLIYPLLKGSPSPYEKCMRPRLKRIVCPSNRSSREVLHGADRRDGAEPKV